MCDGKDPGAPSCPQALQKHLSSSSWSCATAARELYNFGDLPLLECDFHKTTIQGNRAEIFCLLFVHPRMWTWHLLPDITDNLTPTEGLALFFSPPDPQKCQRTGKSSGMSPVVDHKDVKPVLFKGWIHVGEKCWQLWLPICCG